MCVYCPPLRLVGGRDASRVGAWEAKRLPPNLGIPMEAIGRRGPIQKDANPAMFICRTEKTMRTTESNRLGSDPLYYWKKRIERLEADRDAAQRYILPSIWLLSAVMCAVLVVLCFKVFGG